MRPSSNTELPVRVVAAILLLTQVAIAWGHAEIVAVEPADGAVLAAPPSEAVVRFSEDVSPIRARLLDADREALDIAFERTVGDTLRVTLPALADGLYLFSFRVASADGHPVAQTVAFRVGKGDAVVGGADASGATDSPAWTIALALRAIATLLVLTSIGLYLYRRLVAATDDRFERGLQNVAMATVFAAVVVFIPAYSGAGIFADETALAALLKQRVIGAQLLFAAAFATFVIASRRDLNGLAIPAIVALGIAEAGAGHTATANLAPLPSVLLFVHVLAVAFWFGSLIALYRTTRPATAELPQTLSRFSTIALPNVVVLIVTGIAMAWLILDTWRGLPGAPYGRLLLLKLLLVAAVCGFALWNKLVLTPRLAARDESAVRAMRRSIGGELIVFVAVFTVTSVLAVTATPTVTAAAPWQSAAFVSEPYALELRYEATPGGALEIVPTAGGAVIDALEIHLRWRDADGKIEAIEREAEKRDGLFVTTLPALPMDAWSLEIELLVDDFTSIRIRDEILLP